MARVSGLVSGLDTDALIQELVSAYQTKQETYVKKQTKLEWTQEIWKGLNTKVYGFYTGALRNARFSSAYNIKKATVSDSTKATVAASSDAVVGTQTLKVNKLAKTAYLTGGKLKRVQDSKGNADTTTKLKGNSTMKELGFDISSADGNKIKVNVSGKESEISITEDMTINNFVVKLKEAGLSANFDETNQRLFVSASGSGAAKEFSITAANGGGLKALETLGLNASSISDVKKYLDKAGMDIERNTDAEYAKYVLANKNQTLEENITDYTNRIDYITDVDKRNTFEKNWANAIDSYKKLKQNLQNEIDGLLYAKDTDGNITTNQTETGKFFDGGVLKSDYIKSVDGKDVVDQDKIKQALNTAGITDASKQEDILSNIDSIRNMQAEQKQADDFIKEIQDTRDSFRTDAGIDISIISNDSPIVSKIPDGATAIQSTIDIGGTETNLSINQTNAENKKEEYANKKTQDQAELALNKELLNNAYKYVVSDDDVVYTDTAGKQWTYGEVNDSTKVDTEQTGIKDKNGNDLTYGDLRAQVNSAYKTSNGTLWNHEKLVNYLNNYKTPENQIEYDNKRTEISQKYQKEQEMAEKQLKSFGKASGMSDGSDIIAAIKNMNDEAIEEMLKKANAAVNATGDGAVRVDGRDAEIVLNGATFTSNTNNFAINGLTITATGETDGEEITINTTADIDGMYKSIKSLIGGFNDLLKEMNTLYYASSSKGYEPLSDAEKEALTDTEVEKWEKKIKDSLLRRDNTLSSIMSVMKNSMAKAYTINGKQYSLSTFGVNTSGYFAVDNEERGLYHIDGDPDDTSTSGNKDKLRAALANDPDAVIQFFQKVSDDMYTQLTKKMARTSLSSSYTIYNDKQMEKQYKAYSDTIDDWDDKIERYTQKYVKQFTAMETAMAKLQSSTSALSSLIG